MVGVVHAILSVSCSTCLLQPRLLVADMGYIVEEEEEEEEEVVVEVEMRELEVVVVLVVVEEVEEEEEGVEDVVVVQVDDTPDMFPRKVRQVEEEVGEEQGVSQEEEGGEKGTTTLEVGTGTGEMKIGQGICLTGYANREEKKEADR